jgi:hypothetical protein
MSERLARLAGHTLEPYVCIVDGIARSEDTIEPQFVRFALELL